ncbi:MAG: hypothetical protein J1E57_10015 [Prevotella sp.]|nr:hypothetical protein [Prevotella sp.]
MEKGFQQEIWCLLKKNISKGQLIGYAIANIIGLSVVLIGILFFADTQCSNSNDDKFFSDDYIVLSKKVAGIGFEPVCFSDDDIDKLGKQKWVTKIGRFTASHFAVNASVSMAGRGLSTYLFFESVPDDFYDVTPKDWEFDPNERFVPIILSRDYLTLYNFGFALPQGLPQLSENVIGAVPITLRITGNDNVTETFEAAIVGFSSRLNTIAVPQSFMDWANDRFYSEEIKNPSRLIVKIDRFAASNMNQYLEQEDIEIAGDKDGTSNMSEFLSIVSSVVTSNGVVICILALFILILSIFLLLQKSKATLRKLMLLGFSPKEISKYYIIVVIVTNVLITIIATLITICCRILWASQLQEIGLGGASVLPMILAALAYLIIITTININVIRRKLFRLYFAADVA